MSRIFRISEIELGEKPQSISSGRIVLGEDNVFYGYWEAYHAKYSLSGVLEFGAVDGDRGISFFQIPHNIKNPLSMYVEPWNDVGRWFTLRGNGYLIRVNGESRIELEELTDSFYTMPDGPRQFANCEDEIRAFFENVDVTLDENVSALCQAPLLANVITTAEMATGSAFGELTRWKFW